MGPNPPRPTTYHGRTGHILPSADNELQDQMNNLIQFTSENEMVINFKKTKVMLFNTGKKYDFQPEINFDDDNNCLDVVEELKLLGVKVTSDLKWHTNTQYICAKGYSRLWMLRNLKRYGASTNDLVDVYQKQCRSVLELAVPAWASGLTKSDIHQIERVQKSAFAIILGDSYTSYKHSLQILKMETPADRRHALCLSFTKKSYKSEKFSKWFCESEADSDLLLTEVKTRTGRYRKSPIPYLTDLLNGS